MYVCICHAVSEPELRAHIVDGAQTDEAIGDRCGAGTGCGMCLERIDDLIDEMLPGRCAHSPGCRATCGLAA